MKFQEFILRNIFCISTTNNICLLQKGLGQEPYLESSDTKKSLDTAAFKILHFGS